MRKRLPLVILALGVLPLMASPSNAQDGCFYPNLTAQYTGGELHLQIELVNHNGFYTTNCWTGVSGVNVYRRTVGAVCGPEILITDTPLAWNGSATELQPFVSAEIIDGGVEANMAYQYIARATGSPNDDCSLGYASTGPAFICHGTLTQAPDCGFSGLSWVTSCLPGCFDSGVIESYAPEAAQYFNTGTPLLIYGEFDGEMGGICNAKFPQLIITSVVEGPCILAVESSTWGAVKAMYR